MYKIVDNDRRYYLLKNQDLGRFTVVRKDGGDLMSEARSVMPGDQPRGGGVWKARWSRSGVDYVASWYSYSWAREVFNRATSRSYDATVY